MCGLFMDNLLTAWLAICRATTFWIHSPTSYNSYKFAAGALNGDRGQTCDAKRSFSVAIYAIHDMDTL